MMPTPIMRFFKWAHLPERLQGVSKDVGQLAERMDETLPDGPEKSAGLRKLLEAKDCFVRAALTAILFLALLPGVAFAQDLTIPETVDSVRIGYEHAGILGAIGAAVAVLVRLFRMGWIQNMLPKAARWASWPRWARSLAVFGVALVATFLAKLGAHMGWLEALTGAVAVTFLAKGAAETGKTVTAPKAKLPA